MGPGCYTVEQAAVARAAGGEWLDADGQAGIDSDKCQIHMEERQRKHPLLSSPARSDCFIKEKNIK